MTRILLTRSKYREKPLHELFSTEAVSCLNLPLLDYVPIALNMATRKPIFDLDLYDKVIFVSQNAVQFGLPLMSNYWPQWPHKLQWFAVGPTTGHSLHVEGIDAIVPELASTEGLLALSGLQIIEGQRVLIVRGEGGRELLKSTLVSSGAAVDYLEVYRRVPVAYSDNKISKLLSKVLKNEKILVPIYSGDATLHLAELFEDYRAQTILIVPSKRLQKIAIESGFNHVVVAKGQSHEAMFACMVKIINSLA